MFDEDASWSWSIVKDNTPIAETQEEEEGKDKTDRSNEDSSGESDHSCYSSEEYGKRKRKTARSRRGNSHKKSSSSSKKGSKSKTVYSSDEDSEYESDESYNSARGNKKNRGSHKKPKTIKHRKTDTKFDKFESESDAKKGELKKPEAVDPEALKFKELIEAQKKPVLDDEPMVGPTPLPRAEEHISYGGALRPEEDDVEDEVFQQPSNSISSDLNSSNAATNEEAAENEE